MQNGRAHNTSDIIFLFTDVQYNVFQNILLFEYRTVCVEEKRQEEVQLPSSNAHRDRSRCSRGVARGRGSPEWATGPACRTGTTGRWKRRPRSPRGTRSRERAASGAAARRATRARARTPKNTYRRSCCQCGLDFPASAHRTRGLQWDRPHRRPLLGISNGVGCFRFKLYGPVSQNGTFCYGCDNWCLWWQIRDDLKTGRNLSQLRMNFY